MNVTTVCKRIRMKLLKQFMLQINARVALSTKSKTHYETLGIRSNATHNEIKSAYYKLTLKYHPDKNKSETAKHMFQQISDAYDVLGNYKSRKQYDRTIAVRHGKVNVVYKPMHRPYAPEENSAESVKYKTYDFDEWTRQHYQRTFDIDMRKKWVRTRYPFQKPQKKNDWPLVYLAIVVCVGFWYRIYVNVHEDFDQPQSEDNNVPKLDEEEK